MSNNSKMLMGPNEVMCGFARVCASYIFVIRRMDISTQLCVLFSSIGVGYGLIEPAAAIPDNWVSQATVFTLCLSFNLDN